MEYNQNLTFGVYEATPNFKAIENHSCVCDKDSMALVAVTGPAEDKESQKYAELFAVAPQLLTDLETLVQLVEHMRPPRNELEKILHRSGMDPVDYIIQTAKADIARAKGES